MNVPDNRRSSATILGIPKINLGINPTGTQIQIRYIPKHTQNDFGYKLGIRPLSPLDLGIRFCEF